MRVVALLFAHNEARFMANCLEHLVEHGVDAYLVDNESTDRTVDIAERFLGRGLLRIESHPRLGVFDLIGNLARLEALAASVDADWLIHMAPDEVFLPPRAGLSLREALEEVDAQGHNAVNFLEYDFIPTREEPDHDHPGYERTMRRYYHYSPRYPHRVSAWKRQDGPVDLATSGGHLVRFPGVRMYPLPFPFRHYQFLSLAHVAETYGNRAYAPADMRRGFHGWRPRLDPEVLELPPAAALKPYISDEALDPSDAWTAHWLARFARPETPAAGTGGPPPTPPAVEPDFFRAIVRVDRAPAALNPHERATARLRVRNISPRTWPAAAPGHAGAVRLSYRWQREGGAALDEEGHRTALPHDLCPGKETTVDALVQAPPSPGRYTLRFDLVCEFVAWFSWHGIPTADVPVVVRFG